jgi:hypothetical protein
VVSLKHLYLKILTIQLNYKLRWPESRMAVNESADWGQGDINIIPDNIDVTPLYVPLLYLNAIFMPYQYFIASSG